MTHTAILLIDCPDQKGLVAAIVSEEDMAIPLGQHADGTVSVPRPDRHATADTAHAAWLAVAGLAYSHFGRFAGRSSQFVWAVVGLVPPALFVTGVMMWVTRVVRRRR